MRRAIAFRASTVYQRVAALRSGDTDSTTTEAVTPNVPELRSWNQAFSPGDREAFQRRLSWDGLDWQIVSRALAADAAKEVTWVPEWFQISAESDWTIWLDGILEHAHEMALEIERGSVLAETALFEHRTAPPFVELVAPGFRTARDFLKQLHGDVLTGVHPVAARALEQQLVKELAIAGERTCYDLFRQVTSTEAGVAEGAAGVADRYAAFVRSMLVDGFATFYLTYPVLARLTALILERWVQTTGEFFSRLKSDRRAIAERFNEGVDPGEVVALAPALSDPHHGRRRVAALTFASGLRLIYKPRDVGLESALSEALARANDSGLQPRQPWLRVLEQPGYGWVEFATHDRFSTEEQVRTYFRRAGGLVCIAHLLRATDLHMENVVATRHGPVLIDAESLMQPAREWADESRPGAVRRDAEEPCVATGLVTCAETGAGRVRYETGGLRGEGVRGSFRPRRAWHGVGSDGLSFTEEHEFFAPSMNRVVLDNVLQKPEDFRDDILDGFAETYRFFAAWRNDCTAADGWLRLFEGRRARVMFRTSDQYAVVQDVLAGPKYQMSGVSRSCAMDILARPFAFDRTRPTAWPIAVEERRALEELDIPHFTVGTDDTVVRSGEQLVGGRFYTRSGLDVVRERLQNLSEADLHIQLQWLVRSLSESVNGRLRAALVFPSPQPEGSNASGSHHLPLATWIGHEFLARNEKADGCLSWAFHPPGKTVTGAAAHCIYNGTLGPVLFLAALAEVTGDTSWADAARLACVPLIDLVDRSDAGTWPSEEPLGIGSGLGSLVYGLTSVGTLLDDESYICRAARVAEYIDAGRIEANRHHDVLDGNAGAILALLALNETTGDRELMTTAMRCGDRLVAAQIHTNWGSCWPTRDGRMLAGFAHGAAGVAYALLRLYYATARRSYLDAALRAHRYERAMFSPVYRNWPLVRAAGHMPGNVAVPMTAWCHGAPGVALARALVKDIVADEDPEIAGEIDVALESTANLSAGNVGDHLCCGNLGRCDVLLTAGRLLNNSSAIEAAMTTAETVVRKAATLGRFQLVAGGFEHVVFDPGFFHGLSGIGYQLLRLVAATRLPSVLASESPGRLVSTATPVPRQAAAVPESE